MEKEKRSNQSAGLLLYRFEENILQVLLVHPGGPFYKNKDENIWSVPKGEFFDDEEKLHAAKREFKEETGYEATGKFTELKPVKYKSGKTVYAFALAQNIDSAKITSNIIEIEFPPKSGKKITIPEVDKASWFSVEDAKLKILVAQVPFIKELQEKLQDLKME